MSTSKQKGKALFLPREPEGTESHWIKTKLRDQLEDMLGDLVPLISTRSRISQLACLVIGVMNDAWIFALDMGLGKTKIGIDIFTARKYLGEVQQCLVICPPIAQTHWMKQITKHSDNTSERVIGTPEGKQLVLKVSKADFVIASHPWLVRVFSKCVNDRTASKKMREVCERFDMVIIDEAHCIKNKKSKGFKGYRKFLAGAPYRYYLVGTPMGSHYTDIWSLYFLTDLGKTYFADYRSFLNKFFSCYLVKKRFPKYSLRKDRRDEFFDSFWNKAIRYEEAEVEDLPSKSFIPVEISMTSEQEQFYEARSSKKDVSTGELMSITAGHHVMLNMKIENIPKIQSLATIVDDIAIGKNDFLIIWHWLVPDGELIARFLRKMFRGLKFGEVRGGIPSATKAKNLDLWADGKLRLLVANPASLGSSVDLFEANTAVYFSNSFSVIHRKQSIKRIHRTGQERPCTYYDLVTLNTIDEHILYRLAQGRDAFSNITKDATEEQIEELRASRGSIDINQL